MKPTPAQILAKHKAHTKKYKTKTVCKAASDLGRLGGNVGGKARAKSLTDNQRSQIASYAANIRWGNLRKGVFMLDR